jgi:hypothetical protein
MKTKDGGKELKKRVTGTTRVAKSPQPKMQLTKTITKMPQPKLQLSQKITVKEQEDNAVNRLKRNGAKEYIVSSRTKPIGSISGATKEEQLKKQKSKMAVKTKANPKVGGGRGYMNSGAMDKLKK